MLATCKLDAEVPECFGRVLHLRSVDEAVQDMLLSAQNRTHGSSDEVRKTDWPDVNSGRTWPVVEFCVAGCKVRKTVAPRPASHGVEDSMGEQLCCRCQVPLILAYASTVHRALDKVVLGNCMLA